METEEDFKQQGSHNQICTFEKTMCLPGREQMRGIPREEAATAALPNPSPVPGFQSRPGALEVLPTSGLAHPWQEETSSFLQCVHFLISCSPPLRSWFPEEALCSAHLVQPLNLTKPPQLPAAWAGVPATVAPVHGCFSLLQGLSFQV